MSEAKQNKIVEKNTAVIVGIGDYVDKSKEDGLNLQELLAKASSLAIQDSGIKDLNYHIDYVGVVRFSVDFLTASNQSNFQYSNFPRTLGNKLGISAKEEVYAPMGGNSPQVLLDDALTKISAGEVDCALLSGGEALQTMIARLKSGLSLDWLDEPGGNPEMIGNNSIGFSEHEKLHGMDLPTNVYPLFANALRGQENKTAKTHLKDSSELFSEFSGPSLKVSKEILKLGIPIGIGIFAEMTMFSGAAIIIGQLGDKILSGHAIALNIASIVFMLPLAIGLAGSTRVGNLLGEGKFLDAKYSSYVGVLLCFFGALLNMLILLLFRESFASIYSNDIDVISIAISLLLYAAIFQIPDGIQMGSLGALRGYKDTFAPMIFIIISYWIFAIPLGYYLTNFGFFEPMGAAGMWVSMILGLILFSIFIFIRLKLVSSRYINNFNNIRYKL